MDGNSITLGLGSGVTVDMVAFHDIEHELGFVRDMRPVVNLIVV